jgi:hypothetical protein
MKTTRILVCILIGAVLTTGCDNKNKEIDQLKKELANLKAKEKQDKEAKQLQKQISTSKQGEVDGQVFIVTKSRENVKMGLVAVSLFDADSVRKSLISVRKELLSRADVIMTNARPLLATVEKLRGDYETNKAVYEEAEDAEKSNKGTLIEQYNKIPGQSKLDDYDIDHPSYFDALDSADTIASKKAVYSEFHEKLVAAREARKAAAKKAESQKIALNDAVDAYNRAIKPQQDLIWQYESLCISSLPMPISSVKTDADGRFRLQVPRTGEFVLVATASREFGGGSESYIWAVVDSLDGKDSKQVFLSNDNLAQAYSPESVIQRLGIDAMQSVNGGLDIFFDY